MANGGVGNEVVGSTLTSDSKGVLTIPVPNYYYDNWYALTIFEGTDSGPIVLMDTVTKSRQYASTNEILSYMQGKVNPAQATEYEAVARMVINGIIGFEFSFKIDKVMVPGNGTDYLNFDNRLHSIVHLYHNNEKIWDFDSVWLADNVPGFTPTPVLHGYSLVAKPDDAVDFAEFPQTWSTRYGTPFFKANNDYEVFGEWGWPVVPEDIRRATLLMVNDIACGNARYQNKYIDSFSNGINRIDYFKEAIKGTGNLIVDQILSKYVVESIRARAL
jgi:hypothetical protein